MPLMLHIATVDRPAVDATALLALCGEQYARRDPATRAVWHDGLACAPSAFPTWQRVWGHTRTVCPACLNHYTAAS
jgi:hypothetical protein